MLRWTLTIYPDVSFNIVPKIIAIIRNNLPSTNFGNAKNKSCLRFGSVEGALRQVDQ
jgi:hypothetical protein